MKKPILAVLSLALALLLLSACGASSANAPASDTPAPTSAPTSTPTAVPTSTPKPAKSSNSQKSKPTVSFTNKYGTSTTICAHSGCTKYIASSGDTNCCPTHSKKCPECGCYIDEDATWCMSCITKAAAKSSSSGKSSSSSYSGSGGKYYCMGKNDTCPNKTSSPYDFYCSSCDPDNDNIEG